MKYRLTGHALLRMEQRNIKEVDIESALAQITTTYPTPKNSTCIIGKSQGKQLKIWVVGAKWPQNGTIIIKTVAWREQ